MGIPGRHFDPKTGRLLPDALGRRRAFEVARICRAARHPPASRSQYLIVERDRDIRSCRRCRPATAADPDRDFARVTAQSGKARMTGFCSSGTVRRRHAVLRRETLSPARSSRIPIRAGLSVRLRPGTPGRGDRRIVDILALDTPLVGRLDAAYSESGTLARHRFRHHGAVRRSVPRRRDKHVRVVWAQVMKGANRRFARRAW